jgi:hypothetical protein
VDGQYSTSPKEPKAASKHGRKPSVLRHVKISLLTTPAREIE